MCTLNFMLLRSFIEHLCTKEENNKVCCTLTFRGQCIYISNTFEGYTFEAFLYETVNSIFLEQSIAMLLCIKKIGQSISLLDFTNYRFIYC